MTNQQDPYLGIDPNRVLISCALSAVASAMAHLNEAASVAGQLLNLVPAGTPDHERARELAERVADLTNGLDQRILAGDDAGDE